jgi:hypothetical protein
MLVLAPTGVYRGRVKTGIDLVLGHYGELVHEATSQTKVSVILVVGKDWVDQPRYKEEWVEDIKAHVTSSWNEVFKLECQEEVIPFEPEEFLIGWLLAKLGSFFKGPGLRKAYIDLTGGTKDWMFAALNAINFYPDVELYNVKASVKRKPTEYLSDEVSDEGLRMLESQEAPAAAFQSWTTPQGPKGKYKKIGTYDQYFLFKAILELAQEKTREKASPQALTEAWIDIQQEDELRRYVALHPEFSKMKDVNFSSLKRSISWYLTAVKRLRLFEVRGGTSKAVKMRLRGAMFALSLFTDHEVQQSGAEETPINK